MQVKGTSLPSHPLIQQVCPAALALLVPWSSVCLTSGHYRHETVGCQDISTFQCVHLLGTGLGAGHTVLDQKPHTNPAPLDILVSAYPPRQTNYSVINTSAVGDKCFEENKAG